MFSIYRHKFFRLIEKSDKFESMFIVVCLGKFFFSGLGEEKLEVEEKEEDKSLGQQTSTLSYLANSNNNSSIKQ